MGIFDDKDDKTEEPTGKRLGDARRKGQVAMSQELSMSFVILAAILTLQATGGWIVNGLLACLRKGLTVEVHESNGVDWITGEIYEFVSLIVPTLIPLMLALVTFALLIGIGQTGPLLSWEKLTPKFEKLNPVKGLGNLVSLRNLVKSGLSVLKLSLLLTVLYSVLHAELPILLNLPELDFAEAAAEVGRIVFQILWWIAVPLFAISILDLIYQRWQHKKDLRMSKQEVKDENKQTEGDPEVKARIKRVQRELAQRRMMEEVPKADVVVTNPTHFAVALKYERSKMNAPTVVAKGSDRIALRIREIAKEQRVPIVEDPPLARALWRGVRLGDEIPARFYQAVASVLAHVMRMKGKVA